MRYNKVAERENQDTYYSVLQKYTSCLFSTIFLFIYGVAVYDVPIQVGAHATLATETERTSVPCSATGCACVTPEGDVTCILLVHFAGV